MVAILLILPLIRRRIKRQSIIECPEISREPFWERINKHNFCSLTLFDFSDCVVNSKYFFETSANRTNFEKHYLHQRNVLSCVSGAKVDLVSMSMLQKVTYTIIRPIYREGNENTQYLQNFTVGICFKNQLSLLRKCCP